MKDKAWSVLKSDSPFPQLTGAVSYDKTLRVLTLPVRLKPGTRYRFFLNSAEAKAFRSADGVPLAPVEVIFTTRGG